MTRNPTPANLRLMRVSGTLLESGWLFALILAPLFYNAHSQNIFEPDKGAIVRSIAL